MNVDLLISDLERSIGSHVDSILNSFCLPSRPPEDPIDVLFREFEADCAELASFYSDPKNWNLLGEIKSLSSNFALSYPAVEKCENFGVLETVSEFETLTSNKLCALVLEVAVAAKESAINALVKTLDYDFKIIRKASLKRLKKLRILDSRRSIPFGKLRAWACDAMKTRGGSTSNNGSGGGKAPLTYAIAAKCARLRRRLSCVFHFARASHAFAQQQQNFLSHTQDHIVARLNQDLMRIRLQLALRLRQQHPTPASPGATNTTNPTSNGTQPCPRFTEDPAGLSRRFEHLAWDNIILTGVASQKLNSSLKSLVENITDLLVILGANSSSLQKLVDTDLPLSQETVRPLVQRSVLSFCHFYSTSVAPDIGSPKHNISLDLFNNSCDDMNDLSASDTECMMDAFDVFDSYVESNAPSCPMDVCYIDSSSASNSSSAYSSARNSPHPLPELETTRNHFTALPHVEDEADEQQIDIISCSVVTSPSKSALPSTDPLDENKIKEGDAAMEEEEEEEGEVIEDPLHADNEEVMSETEMTEQAIMREWAPVSTEKKTKMPFDAVIQKTLDNASKSCNRELTTMVTLDIARLPPKQSLPRHDVSSTLTREIGGTTILLRRRRGGEFVKHTYRYSREEMQLIRTKIQESLSRQKTSKMLYRKYIRRR